MNIRLSPTTRAKIKEMAGFYNETPEGLVTRFIEGIIDYRFQAYKVAVRENELILRARIAAGRPENNVPISDIRRAVLDEYGDQGTCVAGMKLRYEGRFIDDQIVQGSVTNEVYFQRIKDAMIANGADPSKFEIEYGWMD